MRFAELVGFRGNRRHLGPPPSQAEPDGMKTGTLRNVPFFKALVSKPAKLYPSKNLRKLKLFCASALFIVDYLHEERLRIL
jgi:hypothetical protein